MPSAEPSPVWMRPTLVAIVSVNASTEADGTYSLLGLMHAWPAFRYLSAAAPFAAWTGSASGITMNGA